MHLIPLRYVLLYMSLTIWTMVFSQYGQWTWMQGDSTSNTSATYGVLGVADPSNTPPGTYEGTEWKDLSGNFWLYDNHDLWKYDPTTLNWTWMGGSQGIDLAPSFGVQGISSTNNHPGKRRIGCASWVDLDGDLWLFGGENLGQTLMNDLWKYSITTGEWTWMKGDTTGDIFPAFGVKGMPSPTVNPGGMAETNAAWIDGTGDLWLFGGEGFDQNGDIHGVWNTLWKYSMSSNSWTWVSGDSILNSTGNYGSVGVPSTNSLPPARRCYSKWNRTNEFWIFGGSSGPDVLNDLWRYEISSSTWTWVGGSDTLGDPGLYISKCLQGGGRYPRARHESRCAWTDYAGNFWLYGGGAHVLGPASMNDLWWYGPSSNEWNWISGDSLPNWNPMVYGTYQVSSVNNDPGPRQGTTGWIDNNNGNLWLFGGKSLSHLNDLWVYSVDPNCFSIDTQVEQLTSPEIRSIFPNPFTEQFTIDLNLTKSSHVLIQIFNINGRLVSTLLDEKRTSGPEIILFDLTDYHLQLGKYLLVVYLDNALSTKKIIKLK